MKIEIFLKSDDGPKSMGVYEVTEETVKQIAEDFMNLGKGSGAYPAMRLFGNRGGDYQTILILRFSELAAIG
jgi:hypothetical protein